MTEWLLEADLSAEPEVPEPPAGVRIRAFQPGDARAAHQVIARALLRQAFHGYYLRGESACRLWTHSETGALSLYERVGMKVRRSNSVFRKALR